MAKRILASPIQIQSPPDTSSVGRSFTVYGNCAALAGSNPPTISVTVMESNDAVIDTRSADTNPPSDTWEAQFNISAGQHRKIKAKTSDDDESGTVTEINVEDPVGTIEIDVTEPDPGEIIVDLGDPERRVRPETKGSHGNGRTVKAFVTRAGKRVQSNNVVVQPNPGGGGAHRNPFKLALRDLFPREPETVPDGKYFLHFVVTRGVNSTRATPTYFIVRARRANPKASAGKRSASSGRKPAAKSGRKPAAKSGRKPAAKSGRKKKR